MPIPAFSGEFRASIVKVDISPDQPQWLSAYLPRKSTGVRDRIYHRILALDDGQTQFFLVASDLTAFSPSVYKQMTEKLEKQTGIKRRQVWWTVTHTHSAPEVGPPGLTGIMRPGRFEYAPNSKYTSWLEDKLIEGIKQARAILKPARLGIGWGFSRANINRRARNVEGATFLGMNPDGPTDHRIGILRIETQDGKLMGVVANYAMHGTVSSTTSTLISGDAPGIVAQYVEKKLNVPMLYVNGAAGNLAPIYSVPNINPDPKLDNRYLEQFQVLLGDKIIEATRRITSTTSDVRLSNDDVIVDTPRKPGMDWVDELSDYARTGSDGQAGVRLPVGVLRINDDIAVWSAPVELFCEISNKIRNGSPFPYTFYFGYSNGWLGYLPTKEEREKGGHEVIFSPFTDQAEDDVVRTVLDYFASAY